MPRDNGNTAPQQERSDIGREFERKSGEIAAETPERSVSATARKAIILSGERETALERHDQTWIRERGRLSNSTLPAPSMDFAAKPHRSLLNEYEERRTEWERARDVIRDQFADRKTSLRSEGQTLVDAFTVSHGGKPDPSPCQPSTQPPRDNERSSGRGPEEPSLRSEPGQGLSREFTHKAPAPGRGRGR